MTATHITKIRIRSDNGGIANHARAEIVTPPRVHGRIFEVVE